MIVDELKKSIMHAAFCGKLTSSYTPKIDIDEMFKNINNNYEKLIENKIIKKDKKVQEPKTSEFPYSIPDTWRWTKLYYIIDVRDGTHDSPKYHKEGIPLITSKNLNTDGTLDNDNVKYISNEDAISINNRSKVDVGDILFAMIGSIGNPVIIEDEPDFCIKNVALFKNVNADYLNNKYLYFYLLYAQEHMKKESSGGVQQFVSLNYLRNYYIPVPPVDEQEIIVEMIINLFNKLDDIIPIENELKNLKVSFSKNMKKSILTSLFKDNLDVEKRHLKELVSFDNLKTVSIGKYNYLDVQYLRTNTNAKIMYNGKYIEKNSLAILMDGENSGELFKIKEDGYLGSTLKKITLSNEIKEKYLIYYLELKHDYFKGNKKGAAIPHLNKDLFNNSKIYLPSLEEQKRVVERIEKILPLCNDVDKLVNE